MEIAHIIGKSIIGLFFMGILFFFALMKSDGFERMPWAVITIAILIVGAFLTQL